MVSLAQSLQSVFNAGAGLVKAPLNLFASTASAATTVAKPLLTSTITAPAVNVAASVAKSQAPSLFESIGKGIQSIFVPKPAPAPMTAPATLPNNGGLLGSLADVFLGKQTEAGRQGGFLDAYLKTKLEPAPQAPSVYVPPVTAPLNTERLDVLERERQPSGLFNIGFPPEPSAKTDIRIVPPAPGSTSLQVIGTPGSTMSASAGMGGSGLLLWLFLGLLVVVAFIAMRRSK